MCEKEESHKRYAWGAKNATFQHNGSHFSFLMIYSDPTNIKPLRMKDHVASPSSQSWPIVPYRRCLSASALRLSIAVPSPKVKRQRKKPRKWAAGKCDQASKKEWRGRKGRKHEKGVSVPTYCIVPGCWQENRGCVHKELFLVNAILITKKSKEDK